MGLPHHVAVIPSDRALKELRDDIQALQKRVQDLEIIVKDMQGEMKDMQAQEVTLIGWQAASQVFDELAKFTWAELPAETKTSLAVHSIFDLHSLFFHNCQYFRYNPDVATPTTRAARSAYETIHRDVRDAIASVSDTKSEHAHPKVPRRDFEILINSLSSGSHHHVFEHLRTTFL